MPEIRFGRLNALQLLLCLILGLSAGTRVFAAEIPTPGPQVPSLSLMVLGSGGPGATGRAGSSYLVLLDDVPRILVDAGPGSFVRIGEASQSLDQLGIVLLTHLHVDHVGELAGLLKARAVSTSDEANIEIFGPSGARGGPGTAFFPSTEQFINLQFGIHGSYAYLPDFASPMRLSAHNLTHAGVLQLHTPVPGLLLRAAPGHHGDAPAMIYRVDFAGKSITFSGDIDARGLPALRLLAKGTDLLVFNSVVLDPPESPAVLYDLHTPPAAIGELAAGAGVHQLLLSHLSPSTDHGRDEVERSIRSHYKGVMVFAEDKQRLALR